MSYKTPGGNKSDYNEQIKDETINMAGGDGTSSAPSHEATHESVNTNVPSFTQKDPLSKTNIDATDTSQNKNISNTVANVDNSTLKTSVGDDYSSEYNKASQAWKDAGSWDVYKDTRSWEGKPHNTYYKSTNPELKAKNVGASRWAKTASPGGDHWSDTGKIRGHVSRFLGAEKEGYGFTGAGGAKVHKDEGGNIIDNRVQNQSTITPKPTPKKDKAWDYVKSVSTPSSSAEKGNTSYQSQQTSGSDKITKKENKAWAKERTKEVKTNKKDSFKTSKQQYKKDIKSKKESWRNQSTRSYGSSTLGHYSAGSYAKSRIAKPKKSDY